MAETQPRVGHLKETSTNDTKKSGRPDGQGGQPSIGHHSEKSVNDGSRSGSAPRPLTTRGYGKAAEDETPGGVKRANDHIRPAKGGSY